MTIRALPAIQAFQRPSGYAWDAPAEAMQRWAPSAATSDSNAEITIYDVIGEDPWAGGGWTARRMAGALRNIGERDISVAINSPGGDVFEGIAIYNLLREHKGRVDVRVMGIAASAASLIAMAGDDIRIGLGAMIMIHNCWGVTVGNRHDMRGAADILETIDGALADIYAARTGKATKRLGEMLDAETWLSASQAVSEGFADGVMEDEAAAPAPQARADILARHQLDVVLAKSGMPRGERRRLLRDLASGGTPGAAPPPATHDAGPDVAASLQRLLSTLTS